MESAQKTTNSKDQTHAHSPSDSQEPSIKSTLMFSEHIRVTTTVVVTNLGAIALFGFGGYFLDQWLETSPAFLIAGVILSFPVAQFIIYRWVKKTYTPSLVEKSRE